LSQKNARADVSQSIDYIHPQVPNLARNMLPKKRVSRNPTSSNRPKTSGGVTFNTLDNTLQQSHDLRHQILDHIKNTGVKQHK
jgi:hypothetical protein